MRVDKPRFDRDTGLYCTDCPYSGADGVLLPQVRAKGKCGCHHTCPTKRTYQEACRLAEQAEKGEKE